MREQLHRLGALVPQPDEVAFPSGNDSSGTMDQAKALRPVAVGKLQEQQDNEENDLKSNGDNSKKKRAVSIYDNATHAKQLEANTHAKAKKQTHANVLATVNNKYTTPVSELIAAHRKQTAIAGGIHQTIEKMKMEDPAKVQMKLKLGLSAKTTDDPENAAALRSRTDCYGKFLYKVHSVMHQTWFDNVMGLVSVARAGLRGGGGSVWGYQVWFP